MECGYGGPINSQEDSTVAIAGTDGDKDDAAANSRSRSPTTSIGSDGTDPADGELGMLLLALGEESAPLPPAVASEMKRSVSGTLMDEEGGGRGDAYGHPLSVEEATSRIPSSAGGISWYATVIPDEYFVDGKLKRGLNQRDFDVEQQAIKPRRPSLLITASDFFSSLTKIPGPDGPRYIFHGILNGWPALRCFELEKIEGQRDRTTAFPSARELLMGQILWKRSWHFREEGKRGIEPRLPIDHPICRVKLRGASWTALGWSKDSPGFVFWFEAHRPEGPRLVRSICRSCVDKQEA